MPLNSVKSLLPDIADCADNENLLHNRPTSFRYNLKALLARFPSLQIDKYISCYFHSYDFLAKLHIFPMKNVRYSTFFIFIALKGYIKGKNILTCTVGRIPIVSE